MQISNLVTLVDTYRSAVNRSEATVSNKVTGSHARLFQRARANLGCTLKTYTEALQWFSDNWPADLEWPQGIERPALRVKARKAS
ncbi:MULTISPECIES: hypothetical protein [Roseobacteraceae]|uniref:hypothetical protein n=1 Tax=Roseobacteraceae TaxID=2854170 RepID=UPI002B26E549|nr:MULTISPECIES: hypothetical protein [Roseobacteraceae]